MGDTISSFIKSGSRPRNNDTAENQAEEWHFDYKTVIGFFLQDATTTNPGTFDAMRRNFGLIEQEYDTDKLLPGNGKDLTQWQRFAFKLKTLNEKAATDVSYRLLFLSRHGNGYHNIGSSYYGSEAWDCYYSTLHSDPTIPSIVFFDAHLTLLGKKQAKAASQFWHRMITQEKIPLPESYYCSPHTRAIQTADLTFSSLPLPSTSPFTPTIKELLREGYGIHTCDRRNTRTYLQETFPSFKIEDSFTETDELYTSELREPPRTLVARMRRLLDDVFEHDDKTCISMISHSGTIGAILAVLKHRTFLLPTGGMIPVLVKVSKVPGPPPSDGSENELWQTKPPCHNDPTKAGLPGYKDIAEYLDDVENGRKIIVLPFQKISDRDMLSIGDDAEESMKDVDG